MRTRRFALLIVATAATLLGPATATALAAPAAVIPAPSQGVAQAEAQLRRLAVVRSTGIDVVVDGVLTRRVGHGGGPATVADLLRALPSDWLTVAGGTATVTTAVTLVRGARLDIGGADGVRTLRLTGGATPGEAASLRTGGGEIRLAGLDVASLDPTTGGPVPATAAGRPQIVAANGGTLEITDSTIADLGAAGSDDPAAGVEFHAGSTGSVERSTFLRGGTGLELDGTSNVRLAGVTVRESVADGLVLSGDRGTTLTDIHATGNGRNGVLVTGEATDRPVGGITTSGNGAYGVAVVGQTGLAVTGVTTASDRAGGLRLSRSSGITVTGFRATDQRVGVFTHVGSHDIVLDQVHTTGGRRGLMVEKTTAGLEVRGSTFDGARVTGVAVNGTDIALNAVHVADSGSAVRVDRGAHDVRLTGVTITGGEDGVVTAPGTTGVVLTGLTVENVESDAVRTFSPNGRIDGAHIRGGTTGIDIAAGTTITNTVINAAQEGIHSRSPDPVRADGLTVDAVDLGVNIAPGSPFLLTDSQVHALESLRGDVLVRGANDLSLPPLNLLGAIGVPLVLLAIVLEEMHTFRQRRTGKSLRRRPPLPAPTA